MLRAILAAIFVLTSIYSAPAQLGVGDRSRLLVRTVGGAAPPSPVVSQNFTTTTTLPAWLDVSGNTGNRMMYDSTGKLTWAPNNQYINSNAATNTARTITTVAGINYYIWIQTSSGSATIVASGTNTSTFNGSAGGTFTAFTATAGTLTLTPTTNYANITQVVVAQITYESALRSDDNVVTGAAAYYGPRFDYDPSGPTARGILVEGSATNVTNSSWLYGSDAYHTPGYSAPDGSLDGESISEGATTGKHVRYVYISSSGLNGIVTTWSIYAKAGTRSWSNIIAADDSAGDKYAWFDLTNGVVGSADAGLTTSIQNVGNGWYRLSVTRTPSSNAVYFEFGPCSADNTKTYTGNNSGNVYAWGAQIEQGSFASSFIPNDNSVLNPSPVTRSADIIKLSGSALTTLQGSAGTVIQEFNLEGDTAATQYQIMDGTNSPLYFDSSRVIKATNGTNILSSAVTAAVGTAIRAGLAWDGSGRAISANGSAAVTDANGLGTIGANVYDGSNNGSNPANGWIRTFAIYGSKLSGSTFTDKTTTGGAL